MIGRTVETVLLIIIGFSPFETVVIILSINITHLFAINN